MDIQTLNFYVNVMCFFLCYILRINDIYIYFSRFYLYDNGILRRINIFIIILSKGGKISNGLFGDKIQYEVIHVIRII